MKKIISFLVIALLCFAGGALANLYILKSVSDFMEALTSSTTYLIGGVALAIIGLLYLMKIMDKKPKSDSKKPEVVDAGGKETEQFYNMRWLTNEELKTLKQFKFYLFSDLKNCKQDGILIRSEISGKNLLINMYSPIHTIVIGTTGSGKTQGYVIPMIQVLSSCGSKPCMVITDPKGELLIKNREKLESEGYDIKVFDLRNPYKSTRWNPLDAAYMKYHEALNLEEKVEVYKDCHPKDVKYKTIAGEYGEVWYGFNGIAYPTEEMMLGDLNAMKQTLIDEAENSLHEIALTLRSVPDGAADKSWAEGAQNFIWGTLLAMLEDSADPELGMTRERFNLYNLNKIVNIKDGNSNDPYETLRNYFHGRPKTSKVLPLVSTAIINAANTVKNYMGLVTDALSIVNDGGIAFATSTNEMDFETFADKPTVLFIEVPDEKVARHPLATMCIVQLYNALIDRANQTKDLELPRNVHFILDEFGNLPKLPNFGQLITVGRSRKVFFSLVVQSYNQLTTKYGQEVADTVKGNCNIKIFIGCDDAKTKEDFSKDCGKQTIRITTTSTSKNGNKDDNKGTNTSTQEQQKPIISPEELGMLSKETIIVKIFRELPIKAKLMYAYKCTKFFNINPKEDAYVASRSLNEEEIYYDITKRNEKYIKPSSRFSFD